MKSLLLILLMFISSLSYSQDIWVADVKNLTISGPAVGNRDLTFGVRNILEEIIQDKDLVLNPNSSTKLLIEIVYFDVKKTSMQLGAFGKKTDETEIVIKGVLITNDTDSKTVIAKGQAKSVSTATLIIDKGGKFSQSDVSTALKKVCEQILNDLNL